MVLWVCASAALALTVEDIAADRSLWPKEVKLTRGVSVNLYENGKNIGQRQLKRGESYRVRSIRAREISVTVDGALARVPPEKTDLVRRVEGGDTSGDFKPRGPAASGELSPFARKIGKDLVVLSGNQFQRMPASRLKGVKYFAIYYSAHWCPPCRKFTPKLVSFYQRVKRSHPEFEMIFVSSDRSANDMAGYMSKTGMNWPALAFDKKRSAKALTKYAGGGIPCLVFVDANGKVLSDSYQGSRYLGPNKVLADISRKLGSG